VIYLDTSALVKLARIEPESAELVTWLASDRSSPLVASALVDVELPRALRRSQPAALGGAAAVLARLYRVEIDAAVRATAAAYTDPLLRSLDAIHLATAETLQAAAGGLTAFVAYDRRLAEAASSLGLPVAAPGRVSS
jgi:hypothetical protein